MRVRRDKSILEKKGDFSLAENPICVVPALDERRAFGESLQISSAPGLIIAAPRGCPSTVSFYRSRGGARRVIWLSSSLARRISVSFSSACPCRNLYSDLRHALYGMSPTNISFEDILKKKAPGGRRFARRGNC